MRLQSINAPRPRRATPPTAPTTIPAIAPPERPDDLLTIGAEVEDEELALDVVGLVALDVWLVVVEEAVWLAEDAGALLVVAELVPSFTMTRGLEIWLAESLV